MSDDTLTLWTITFNPTDAPGKYVVRGHDILPGATRPHPKALAVVDTLEQARAAAPGSHNLGRHTDDDPVIVETWV